MKKLNQFEGEILLDFGIFTRLVHVKILQRNQNNPTILIQSFCNKNLSTIAKNLQLRFSFSSGRKEIYLLTIIDDNDDDDDDDDNHLTRKINVN